MTMSPSKKKPARKRPVAKKVARKNPAGRTTARPQVRAAAKPASRTVGTRSKTATKKSAAKKATEVSGKKRSKIQPRAKSATAKKSKVTPTSAKPASSKPGNVSRIAAAGGPPAPRKSAEGRSQQTAAPRAVSPAVARRHFLKILEAKQERVRQGPSYPPANAFTGHKDPAAAPASAPTPTADAQPEAAPDRASTFDGAAAPHGRGNQGMRSQK
jgi:hypothetical protein